MDLGRFKDDLSGSALSRSGKRALEPWSEHAFSWSRKLIEFAREEEMIRGA